MKKKPFKMFLSTISCLVLLAGLFQVFVPLLKECVSISYESIDSDTFDWIWSEAKDTEIQWNEQALSSENSDDYIQVWYSFMLSNLTALKIRSEYFTAESTDDSMNRVVYVTYPITPIVCGRFDKTNFRIGVIFNIKDLSKEEITNIIRSLTFVSNENSRIILSNINLPNFSTKLTIPDNLLVNQKAD